MNGDKYIDLDDVYFTYYSRFYQVMYLTITYFNIEIW